MNLEPDLYQLLAAGNPCAGFCHTFHPSRTPSIRLDNVQAAIARLTVPRWRPLLLVRDDISKANPVHRAGRYGHRTQVLELLLQHAPR